MDLYEILQVNRNADAEVIRAAYRALARRHHPDVGGRPELMVSINEAWSILGNAARRRGYDITLRRTAAVAAAPGRATPAPTATQETRAPSATRTAAPSSARAGASASVAEEPRYQPQPTIETAPSGDRILDFGRYAGWSLSQISRQDPDYLLWLERTMVGRSLRADIEHVLRPARSSATAVATAPAPPLRRGRWFF
jgi:curved DNA-binding protein CbpA